MKGAVEGTDEMSGDVVRELAQIPLRASTHNSSHSLEERKARKNARRTAGDREGERKKREMEEGRREKKRKEDRETKTRGCWNGGCVEGALQCNDSASHCSCGCGDAWRRDEWRRRGG